jgi:hypothetical protein
MNVRGPALLLAIVALFAAGGISAAQQAGEAVAPLQPLDPPAVTEPAPAEGLPPADAETAGEAALANPNPLSGLTLDSLAATRTAPLFTPSRTAPVVDVPVTEEPVAAAVEVPTAGDEPPQLELIGIVLTETSQTALLRDPGSGEVYRIASGEQINNWELKIVDARSVEFHRGDRVEDLKMFDVFPVSATPGEPAADGMPSGFDGQAQPPPGRHSQDPNEGQSVDGSQPPDSPNSSDIVRGAEDVQNSDVVRSPNEATNPSGGTASDPNAPPPADFAPPVGGAPIPDEGTPPPETNSN